MLTRIKIEGLRGIAEADIDGLAPVTILVGANGSGKSTVLEAVGVACAGWSPAAAFEAISQREWLGLEGMKFVFTGEGQRSHFTAWTGQASPEIDSYLSQGSKDTQLVYAARGKSEEPTTALDLSFGGTKRQVIVDSDGRALVTEEAPIHKPFSLETAFVDRPAGACHRFEGEHFSSALRDALAKIKLSPYYDDLIEYLQIIRPSLTSIESLAVGERDEPHVFEKEPRVGYPLAYAGDGFRRTLLLAAAFARTKGGVVAIDEPEAFAHPRLFSSVARMIRRAVGDGTQVFLATHSLEFIEATLSEYEDNPETVAVVGLDNDRGKLDPVVITGPNAYRRVVELGDDLRL